MSIKLTTEDFIKKANLIHDSKYRYSLVNYINAHVKIDIICPIHGNFKLTPNKHINRKCGCPKCGNILKNNLKRTTIEQFIKKSNKIHNNFYNYSLVKYKATHTKVCIICPIHGEFEQKPSKHLQGSGCDLCGNKLISKFAKENPTGWSLNNWIISANMSKNFDSFKVYIIECWNEEEKFYKIGRTFTSIKNRFKSKKFMPYNWKIIKEISGNSKEIYELEKELKRLNKENKYTPIIKFNGMYECFKNISNL